MTMERLEPRNLMAAIGLDTTFGDGGTVQAINGRYAAAETGDPAALAIDGAIFAVRRVHLSDRHAHIIKLDPAGNLDTSWGNNGAIEVFFNVKALAYDKRTGHLYVAGDDNLWGLMSVMRLTSRGRRDFGFGDGNYGGVANFLVPNDKSPTIDWRFDLQSITVLGRQEVLIGFARETARNLPDWNFEGTNDLYLMRVRRNGTRDPDFGDRGLTKLWSGAYAHTSGERDSISSSDLPELGSVAPQANGTFRAVFTRRIGLVDDTKGPKGFLDSTLQVKARTVSAAGVVGTTDAHSWTINPPAPTGDQQVQPLLAAVDAGDGVTLIARQTINRQGRVASFSYSLIPGQRPRATPFGTRGLIVDMVVRDGFSSYYAGERDGTIARFTRDFQLDRTFAARGLARTSSGVLSSLNPDPSQRVLAAADVLERFT